MDIRQLSPQYFVTGQISASDLAELAENGFRTVINNRPDHEAPHQPLSDDIAAEAARLGLRYLYLPVVSGRLTERDVENFGRAVRDIEGPVLLFCRSGARSAALWQLSRLRADSAGL